MLVLDDGDAAFEDADSLNPSVPPPPKMLYC